MQTKKSAYLLETRQVILRIKARTGSHSFITSFVKYPKALTAFWQLQSRSLLPPKKKRRSLLLYLHKVFLPWAATGNPKKENKLECYGSLDTFFLHNVSNENKQALFSDTSFDFTKFYINEISDCSGTWWGHGKMGGRDTKELQENPKGNFGSDGYVHQLDYDVYISRHSKLHFKWVVKIQLYFNKNDRNS